MRGEQQGGSTQTSYLLLQTSPYQQLLGGHAHGGGDAEEVGAGGPSALLTTIRVRRTPYYPA